MPRLEWYLHSFFVVLIAVCGLLGCIAILNKGSIVGALIMFIVFLAGEYGMARVIYKMRMLYK